jgi:hypothetical protein
MKVKAWFNSRGGKTTSKTGKGGGIFIKTKGKMVVEFDYINLSLSEEEEKMIEQRIKEAFKERGVKVLKIKWMQE